MPNRENTNRIEEILKETGCDYERHDCLDVDVFPCQITDPTGRGDSLCRMVYVGDSAIEVELELDQKAADRKAEMAEFLTRANNGIKQGAFEFNRDDGAIAFKASCPVSVLASPDWRTTVASFLELPEKTVAKYAKDIEAVIQGKTVPETQSATNKGTGASPGVLKELLATFKKGASLPDKVMKCPKCHGKKSFKYEDNGFFSIPIWRCPDCGYKKVVTQMDREFPNGFFS